MDKLIVARECQLQSNTKGLDRHDGDRSHGRADRDVDERVLLSVEGGDSVNHHGRENRHCQAVKKEPWSWSAVGSRHSRKCNRWHHTWLHGVSQNLINRFHGLVRGRMKNDHHRTEQAHSTAQFSQNTQSLMEDV